MYAKFIVFILSFFFTVNIYSATIILQQGTDGYTGCEDTYIDYENPSTNYGSLTTITVKEESG